MLKKLGFYCQNVAKFALYLTPLCASLKCYKQWFPKLNNFNETFELILLKKNTTWVLYGTNKVRLKLNHFQANFSDHTFNTLHTCHLRAGSPDHPAVLGHRLLHVSAAVRLLRLLEPVHAAVLHTARSSSPGFFTGESLVYLENVWFYFYCLSQSSTILFGMRPQLLTDTLD